MGNFKNQQVNYRIRESQVAVFTEYAKENVERLPLVVEELVDDGLKISATYVDSANSYCVTVTCKDETSPNKDKWMSSWSDDLGEAILITAFKHFKVFNQGKWEEDGQPTNWG